MIIQQFHEVVKKKMKHFHETVHASRMHKIDKRILYKNDESSDLDIKYVDKTPGISYSQITNKITFHEMNGILWNERRERDL